MWPGGCPGLQNQWDVRKHVRWVRFPSVSANVPGLLPRVALAILEGPKFGIGLTQTRSNRARKTREYLARQAGAIRL